MIYKNNPHLYLYPHKSHTHPNTQLSPTHSCAPSISHTHSHTLNKSLPSKHPHKATPILVTPSKPHTLPHPIVAQYLQELGELQVVEVFGSVVAEVKADELTVPVEGDVVMHRRLAKYITHIF